MKPPRFLLALACAASFTCVSSSDEPGQLGDEPDTDEPAAPEPDPIARRWDGGGEAPGEVIHIEGDVTPGSQGHGVPWGPGPGTANGGVREGGSQTGGPGRQPERKVCQNFERTPESLEVCLQCCFYNHDHVDGWKCRKIKNDKKRGDCWKKAAQTQAACQVGDCGRDRPIFTASEVYP